MAAYAALASLENIIRNLQNHCRPPITLHKQQARLLTQKLTFLEEFLQVYNPTLGYSKEADPLESRIARAAYAAEDAIESHIFYQFNSNSDGVLLSFDGLYEDLEKVSLDGALYEALAKVIQDMALIQKEAIEIKETVVFQNQLHEKSTPPSDSSRSSSSSLIAQKSMMVGADDQLLEMKSRLTADARDLQTVPIVGMGGSGKTTLALNIYQDRLIKEHFYNSAWVTISQEYNTSEILIQLLTQLIKEFDQDLSEGELGEVLHKYLYGRKYMIILDDMWSVKAWDGVKRFLPNNKNGSRIVITTRLSNLASALPNSNILEMELLDEDASWALLVKTVFGKKGCPSGFEKIGKKIGKGCKGLPLSIVVVGGLLAKSELTIESWEHMEGNLNAIVNLDDGERCLRTLYMSYKQLPIHLKPCFLYMGIYREDHEIRISYLIRLWIAEGFLKPVIGKRAEDVAREYLKDLIDRNLIMIHKVGSIGSIKECKVHDLLRDLCLREAQKQGFYIVFPGHEVRNDVRRIVMSGTIPGIEKIVDLSSGPPPRSVILDSNIDRHLPSRHILRLLRTVCTIGSREILDNMNQLVNSRFVHFPFRLIKSPSLVWRFWNLQILIETDYLMYTTAPVDIWYMSHIRHIYINGLHLPDPPPQVQDGYMNKGDDDRFCLTNLDCLDKLESLYCKFNESMFPINYPQSLEKLHLAFDSSQCLEDILDKVGALPLLQKLNLYSWSFEGGRWETTEGQFRSLKFLSLSRCEGLQVWTSETSHFPRLEQLRLYRVDGLEEIPSDFAEISTLRLIDLDSCCDSAIESAWRILEEQEALYGEEETALQIHVELWGRNDPTLESFRSPNFHFR